MSLQIVIGVVLGVILPIAVLFIFNRLVAKRQKLNTAWADIDVWLKRRSDIIPSLVSTVSAYSKHETALIKDITEKRTQVLDPSLGVAARASAETNLSAPVARLLAIAEAYPDMKASENFLSLQRALTECEEKIEMSRRYYNGVVKQYNMFAAMFPMSLIARTFKFQTANYFSMEGTST